MDLEFEFLENQRYSIALLPGAINDFFGLSNDTLQLRVATGSPADYGNLSLNITGAVRYPIIVQLTTNRGEIKREKRSDAPETLEFNSLEPGNYGVRVIFDENENGKWDTGSYLKRLQPERISYYPDMIEMRANWEKIETFIISN